MARLRLLSGPVDGVGKKTGQVWVDFAKTWARLPRLGLGEHLGKALSGGLELSAEDGDDVVDGLGAEAS